MNATSETPAPLTTTQIGDGDHRVVFLHGLFGRGKNFTMIARGLEPEFSSLLVDLPDHGSSPWSEHFSYVAMADTVAAQLRAGFASAGPVDVVGHSMGGKVAMVLALRHPQLVRRLVVVDIAPVPAQDERGEFEYLLDELARVSLDGLTRRSDVDDQLRERITNAGVRGFLLQNLRAEDGTLRWEPNLGMLRRELDAVRGFPADELAGDSFDGPVLWIAGERSDYVRDEDLPTMRGYFPRVRRLTMHGAGHWVHAAKPAETIQALRVFLGS